MLSQFKDSPVKHNKYLVPYVNSNDSSVRISVNTRKMKSELQRSLPSQFVTISENQYGKLKHATRNEDSTTTDLHKKMK